MAKLRHKQHKYKAPNPTQQSILAFLLLVIATILSRQTGLSRIESDLFYAVYNLPEWLYFPLYAITQLGSIYVLGALLVIYLMKLHYHIVIRLLMGGALAYLLAGFAKSIWGRARPHEILADVTTLDYFQGPGFPSGHVAFATVLAFTVGHYLGRKFWWVTALWIASVGLSRMYLGVHLPLDIIGGIAIGWFSYAIFRHVRVYDIHPKSKKAV